MMSNKPGVGGFYFPNVYQKEQRNVEDLLCKGDIDYADSTKWSFADEFLCFALETKFLEFIDRSYPNPREKNEVPIWFLMACQLLLRIHQSGKYSNLKELLNSGSVLAKVGFNVGSRSIGFNEKNKMPRKTAIDQDTVRKFFKDTDHTEIRRWHNQQLQSWFKTKKAFHRDGIFLLDQTHIVVPRNKNYEDAVMMPVDEHGQFYKDLGSLTEDQKKSLPHHSCYCLSTLLHTDKSRETFHIAGYEFGPGNEDEFAQANRFVPDFCQKNPGVMKELIVDRGYVDGSFIGKMKKDHGVDVLLPLKRHMDNYKDAVAIAERKDNWTTVQEEKDGDGELLKKTIAVAVNDMNLWDKCSVPIHTTVLKSTRWSDRSKQYKEHFWVLGSTKKYRTPTAAFQRYRIRTEIEERYRQFKLSWNIGKFPSPTRSLVESHICFTLLVYSLLELYLRRHQYQAQIRKMIGTLKSDESLGKDAVIVYSQGAYCVISFRRYTKIITELDDESRRKINALMAAMEEDDR